MRRGLAVIGFVVLVAVLIVGGFVAVDQLAGESAGDDVVIDKPTLGRAAIVEADLIERETFPGILRFADPQLVTAPTGGTVTQVPEVGQVLQRGDTVIEVDGLPVVLFVGERPMWRTLARLDATGSEMTGPDVQQLEENLVALGYPSRRDEEDAPPSVSDPDETFDDDTVRLIQDWRDALGLPEADIVELGRILYLPEGVRIARVIADRGALITPGMPILELSDPEQEVFLQLPVDKRDLVEEGDAVRVTLPDDSVVAATISSVGNVVTYLDPDAPGVIDVTILLDDPALGASFEESPVDVEIVSNEVRGALAVPVNALLALAEGGYALEVDRGGAVLLVAVETGVFVDGLVEVTGDIAAGDMIIVPE